MKSMEAERGPEDEIMLYVRITKRDSRKKEAWFEHKHYARLCLIWPSSECKISRKGIIGASASTLRPIIAGRQGSRRKNSLGPAVSMTSQGPSYSSCATKDEGLASGRLASQKSSRTMNHSQRFQLFAGAFPS